MMSIGLNGSNPEELCPYAMVGECRYGEQCVLLHGNMCDYCGQFCLHPYDPVQREKHTRVCVFEGKIMSLYITEAKTSTYCNRIAYNNMSRIWNYRLQSLGLVIKLVASAWRYNLKIFMHSSSRFHF